MPHISVMLYPGRDKETKELIAKNLQAELMRTMNAPANYFSVSIEDVAPEKWDETVAAKVNHDDLIITSDYVK